MSLKAGAENDELAEFKELVKNFEKGANPCLKKPLDYARVVELVDTGDLKSPDRKIVPVQVRPRAPLRHHFDTTSFAFILFSTSYTPIYDVMCLIYIHREALIRG